MGTFIHWQGGERDFCGKQVEISLFSKAIFFGHLMLYFLPIGQVMFYRYPRDSAQSLTVRTGYALLSGHLTANGTSANKKANLRGLAFFAVV